MSDDPEKIGYLFDPTVSVKRWIFNRCPITSFFPSDTKVSLTASEIFFPYALFGFSDGSWIAWHLERDVLAAKSPPSFPSLTLSLSDIPNCGNRKESSVDDSHGIGPVGALCCDSRGYVITHWHPLVNFLAVSWLNPSTFSRQRGKDGIGICVLNFTPISIALPCAYELTKDFPIVCGSKNGIYLGLVLPNNPTWGIPPSLSSSSSPSSPHLLSTRMVERSWTMLHKTSSPVWRVSWTGHLLAWLSSAQCGVFHVESKTPLALVSPPVPLSHPSHSFHQILWHGWREVWMMMDNWMVCLAFEGGRKDSKAHASSTNSLPRSHASLPVSTVTTEHSLSHPSSSTSSTLPWSWNPLSRSSGISINLPHALSTSHLTTFSGSRIPLPPYPPCVRLLLNHVISVSSLAIPSSVVTYANGTALMPCQVRPTTIRGMACLSSFHPASQWMLLLLSDATSPTSSAISPLWIMKRVVFEFDNTPFELKAPSTVVTTTAAGDVRWQEWDHSFPPTEKFASLSTASLPLFHGIHLPSATASTSHTSNAVAKKTIVSASSSRLWVGFPNIVLWGAEKPWETYLSYLLDDSHWECLMGWIRKSYVKRQLTHTFRHQVFNTLFSHNQYSLALKDLTVLPHPTRQEWGVWGRLMDQAGRFTELKPFLPISSETGDSTLSPTDIPSSMVYELMIQRLLEGSNHANSYLICSDLIQWWGYFRFEVVQTLLESYRDQLEAQWCSIITCLPSSSFSPHSNSFQFAPLSTSYLTPAESSLEILWYQLYRIGKLCACLYEHDGNISEAIECFRRVPLTHTATYSITSEISHLDLPEVGVSFSELDFTSSGSDSYSDSSLSSFSAEVSERKSTLRTDLSHQSYHKDGLVANNICQLIEKHFNDSKKLQFSEETLLELCARDGITVVRWCANFYFYFFSQEETQKTFASVNEAIIPQSHDQASYSHTSSSTSKPFFNLFPKREIKKNNSSYWRNFFSPEGLLSVLIAHHIPEEFVIEYIHTCESFSPLIFSMVPDYLWETVVGYMARRSDRSGLERWIHYCRSTSNDTLHLICLLIHSDYADLAAWRLLYQGSSIQKGIQLQMRSQVPMSVIVRFIEEVIKSFHVLGLKKGIRDDSHSHHICHVGDEKTMSFIISEEFVPFLLTLTYHTESSLPTRDGIPFIYHTVNRRDETWETIAKRYEITIGWLKQWNELSVTSEHSQPSALDCLPFSIDANTIETSEEGRAEGCHLGHTEQDTVDSVSGGEKGESVLRSYFSCQASSLTAFQTLSSTPFRLGDKILVPQFMMRSMLQVLLSSSLSIDPMVVWHTISKLPFCEPLPHMLTILHEVHRTQHIHQQIISSLNTTMSSEIGKLSRFYFGQLQRSSKVFKPFLPDSSSPHHSFSTMPLASSFDSLRTEPSSSCTASSRCKWCGKSILSTANALSVNNPKVIFRGDCLYHFSCISAARSYYGMGNYLDDNSLVPLWETNLPEHISMPYQDLPRQDTRSNETLIRISNGSDVISSSQLRYYSEGSKVLLPGNLMTQSSIRIE